MPPFDSTSDAVLLILPGILCVLVMLALPVIGVLGLQRWTNSVLIGWREQRRLMPYQQRQLPYFQRWAAERGMVYTPRADAWAAIGAPWPFIGEDTRAEHVFTGMVRGRETAAFQYSARLIEQGRSAALIRDKRRIVITCVAVRLPAPRLDFLIMPGTAFDKAAQRAGFAPVGLRYENTVFNERFRISAENERFAHDVLTPRMMEWVLSEPMLAQRPLMIHGSFLFTWSMEPITLQPLDPLIRTLHDFMDRIPDHVWSRPLMRPRPPQTLDHTCRGTCE